MLDIPPRAPARANHNHFFFDSAMAGGLFHFKKDHAQYSLKPGDYATKPLFVENRFLNEFFLYVLDDLHTCQSLGALQFTSDDPTFVKLMVEDFYRLIPATATAPEMPLTRAFSRQLIAYLACFLPVLRTSGPTTAGFPAFAMTSTPQPSNVWMRPATMRSSFT
jgi:hypothetical protein